MQKRRRRTGRREGRRDLAPDMARLAEPRDDQLALAVQEKLHRLLELRVEAVGQRIERPRLVMHHLAAKIADRGRGVGKRHAATVSTCGSPAEMTCAATRSPITLSVVRHMSRKRSTPS